MWDGRVSAPKHKAVKFTMRDYCNLILHLAREDQTLSNKVSTLGISDMMKVAYVADDARKVLMLAAGGITELSGLLVIDHGGELVTPRGKVALLMEDLQLDGKQTDANHQSQTPPMPVHSRRTSTGFQSSTFLLERETARNHEIPHVAANRIDIGNDSEDDDGLGPPGRFPSLEELYFRDDRLDANGQLPSPDPRTPIYAAGAFPGSHSISSLSGGGNTRSIDFTPVSEDRSEDESDYGHGHEREVRVGPLVEK